MERGKQFYVVYSLFTIRDCGIGEREREFMCSDVITNGSGTEREREILRMRVVLFIDNFADTYIDLLTYSLSTTYLSRT